MRGLVSVFIVVFVAGALAAAGLAGSAPKTRITLAIQPTETASEIQPRARELERFLESRLPDVDVEILIPLSYAGIIEALRFGHADAAFMSAWPMLLAERRAGASVALAEVREVVIGRERREASYYFSYWVVLKDSPIETLGQLRGMRACFPSPLSTSGYLAPLAKLVELGLVPRPDAEGANPEAFFGRAIFGGGYGQCWAALRQRQVDVTVIAGDVAESLYREVLEATKVLEEQGPIPSHGVVLRRGFPAALRARFLGALGELGTPEHRPLMRRLISAIFVRFQRTTSADHLAALRQALELTGLSFVERLR